MEHKELAMSSLAFFIVALLIAATALFYVAGMQMRDEAGWAMEVCYIAKICVTIRNGAASLLR